MCFSTKTSNSQQIVVAHGKQPVMSGLLCSTWKCFDIECRLLLDAGHCTNTWKIHWSTVKKDLFFLTLHLWTSSNSLFQKQLPLVYYICVQILYFWWQWPITVDTCTFKNHVELEVSSQKMKSNRCLRFHLRGFSFSLVMVLPGEHRWPPPRSCHTCLPWSNTYAKVKTFVFKKYSGKNKSTDTLGCI